jgi:hypothetical protein
MIRRIIRSVTAGEKKERGLASDYVADFVASLTAEQRQRLAALLTRGTKGMRPEHPPIDLRAPRSG